MTLRWLMMVVATGWLVGCGQTGPLYLPEEELVTEEVEVTETVAGEQVTNAAGEVVDATAETTEVDASATAVEVEQVADPQPLGPEPSLPASTGPGE